MCKFILWITTVCLMFFLPNEVVNAYGSLARFGSGLFLLVQVLILLDFTHTWNAAWVAKDEQFWCITLLMASTVCYLGSFVLSGFLFYWFNPVGQECQLNIFFIVSALIFGLGFAHVSLHPQIYGSLLPASVIALYCTYLCYSALSKESGHYLLSTPAVESVGDGSANVMLGQESAATRPSTGYESSSASETWWTHIAPKTRVWVINTIIQGLRRRPQLRTTFFVALAMAMATTENFVTPPEVFPLFLVFFVTTATAAPSTSPALASISTVAFRREAQSKGKSIIPG